MHQGVNSTYYQISLSSVSLVMEQLHSGNIPWCSSQHQLPHCRQDGWPQGDYYKQIHYYTTPIISQVFSSPWVSEYLSWVIWTMLSNGQTTQTITSVVKVARLPRFINQTSSCILTRAIFRSMEWGTWCVSTDLATNQQILLQSTFITDPAWLRQTHLVLKQKQTWHELATRFTRKLILRGTRFCFRVA